LNQTLHTEENSIMMIIKMSWSVFLIFWFLLAGMSNAGDVQAMNMEKIEINGMNIEYSIPEHVEPVLSRDGLSLVHGSAPKVLIHNPAPSDLPLRIPPPQSIVDDRGLPMAAQQTATFEIEYVEEGGADEWGEEECFAFPEDAREPFDAAAAIWGSILRSPVPITIRTCWADLGGSTLGYSGGGRTYRNFPNAPLSDTWYEESLANALRGEDMGEPGEFDMHINYNKNFDWYLGTDGITPSNQVDFMTVVLHEIAHGLNFSGSMRYASGEGSWGYGTDYPNIYDTFMQDGSGNDLIDTDIYPNPSESLGNAITSDDIWFNGPSAVSANNNQRVKMYAPFFWLLGSSYSHVDYDTFSGTENRLMVYVISSGDSVHDPGPATTGILKDLGWPMAEGPGQTGSLMVSIEPAGARDAGAQWRRAGTSTWLDSGQTESGIATGEYTVEFKDLAGWDAPDDIQVQVNEGETTSATGIYARHTGSLTVYISPQEAVDAGMQWRRRGTQAWFNSGETESGVPTGEYTVEFKAVDGFSRPATEKATVTKDSDTQLIWYYQEAEKALPGVLMLLLDDE
jgi:hypothetical protein